MNIWYRTYLMREKIALDEVFKCNLFPQVLQYNNFHSRLPCVQIKLDQRESFIIKSFVIFLFLDLWEILRSNFIYRILINYIAPTIKWTSDWIRFIRTPCVNGSKKLNKIAYFHMYKIYVIIFRNLINIR